MAQNVAIGPRLPNNDKRYVNKRKRLHGSIAPSWKRKSDGTARRKRLQNVRLSQRLKRKRRLCEKGWRKKNDNSCSDSQKRNEKIERHGKKNSGRGRQGLYETGQSGKRK